MAILDFETVQGTTSWYQRRGGIPTASMFSSVMTPKTRKPAEARKKYGARLLSERLLNNQTDSLDKIEHIAHGRANEPNAVASLEDIYGIQTLPIGFATTNDKKFGASPDRVCDISKDKSSVGMTVECKSPTIVIQMERLMFGDNDSYICQRMGQLWVLEADKGIFFSHVDCMPPYRVESGRDEGFIKDLVDCLYRFSDELDEWEEKVRKMGLFMAFPSLVTPLDAELGEELRHTPLGDDLPAEINRQVQDWHTDGSPLPEGYAWD